MTANTGDKEQRPIRFTDNSRLEIRAASQQTTNMDFQYSSFSHFDKSQL